MTLFGELTPEELLTLTHAAEFATPTTPTVTEPETVAVKDDRPLNPFALPPCRLDDERMAHLRVAAALATLREWQRICWRRELQELRARNRRCEVSPNAGDADGDRADVSAPSADLL